MEKAVNAMKNGMSLRTACKTFNVPKSTLSDKISGKTPVERKIGASPILTPEEEKHLVTWVLHSAKAGFPITKNQLLESVQMLMYDLKKENPFRNGKPGRHWFESFLKRNPQISLRVSQNLSGQRANVSEEIIRKWFDEITTYLKDQNLNINEPERIYNCAETAITLCPKGENVLIAAKGDKTVSVSALSNNDEQELITNLFVCNAAGHLPPPLIMLPYNRMPTTIEDQIPGKSDVGWMTGQSFFDYIANVFLPWLKQNKINMPILLFLDGHRSRLTMQLSEFCSKNEIVLICLYPNASHILQPLDVALFHPLKLEWRRTVVNWRMEHDGNKLSQEQFGPLLERVLLQLKERLPTMIQDGFKTCGLFPFNPDNIPFSMYFKTTSIHSNIRPTDKNTTMSFLRLFEKYNEDKIDTFKSSGFKWNGDVEDTNLYYIWKKLNESLHENVQEELNTSLSENKIFEPVFATSTPKLHLNTEVAKSKEALCISDKNDMVLLNQTAAEENVHTLRKVEKRTNEIHDSEPDKSLESFQNNLPNVPAPFKKVKETIPSVVVPEAWQEFTKAKVEKRVKAYEENYNIKKLRLEKEEKNKTFIE